MEWNGAYYRMWQGSEDREFTLPCTAATGFAQPEWFYEIIGCDERYNAVAQDVGHPRSAVFMQIEGPFSRLEAGRHLQAKLDNARKGGTMIKE